MGFPMCTLVHTFPMGMEIGYLCIQEVTRGR